MDRGPIELARPKVSRRGRVVEGAGDVGKNGVV